MIIPFQAFLPSSRYESYLWLFRAVVPCLNTLPPTRNAVSCLLKAPTFHTESKGLVHNLHHSKHKCSMLAILYKMLTCNKHWLFCLLCSEHQNLDNSHTSPFTNLSSQQGHLNSFGNVWGLESAQWCPVLIDGNWANGKQEQNSVPNSHSVWLFSRKVRSPKL